MLQKQVYLGQPKNLQFHWCGFFESAVPWRHDERVNPDYELMIGIEGTMYLEFAGQQLTLGPGEMLLLPPDVKFIGNRDSQLVRFYWLHFACENLRLGLPHPETKRQPDLWQLPFYEKQLLLDNEIVLLQQMQLLKQADYPDHTLLNTYTYAIMQSISDKFFRGGEPNDTRHYLVDYVKNFIRWNYQKPLNIESIASYFGYNKAYLSNLFSRAAGLTITQYLNSTRLEAARQQLLTSQLTLKEVAYENGFEDEKYFSRLFSKRYQLSPREYRKKYGHINKM